MAHVSQRKKEIVGELKELLKQYPVIGIADLYGVPASQLNRLRSKLREHMLIRMAKKSLMRIAFKEVEKDKPGITKLAEHFEGLPCLIFSKKSPFKIVQLLNRNRTNAPAKPGQIAPHDIVVPAGPTQFTPGPIISEFSSLGIKSGVENGNIVIKSDAVVVKQGEEISSQVASVLMRLGIEPMEIGIRITAVYEGGVIYTADFLDIDSESYIRQISEAHSAAYALSIGIGYANKENIKALLAKAHNESFNLTLKAKIVTNQTVQFILKEAHVSSLALKQSIKLNEVG